MLASLFLCAIPVYAADAPFNSASISGLGARNIGSAAMSGRISAIAGVREPSGKITLFVGAASGGGGIFSQQSDRTAVTLTRVKVTSNTALDGVGGGISVANARRRRYLSRGPRILNEPGNRKT